jgi:hypothetical protein
MRAGHCVWFACVACDSLCRLCSMCNRISMNTQSKMMDISCHREYHYLRSLSSWEILVHTRKYNTIGNIINTLVHVKETFFVTSKDIGLNLCRFQRHQSQKRQMLPSRCYAHSARASLKKSTTCLPHCSIPNTGLAPLSQWPRSSTALTMGAASSSSRRERQHWTSS